MQAAYDYLVHRDYGSSDRTFLCVHQIMPASYIEVDVARSIVCEQSVWWRPSIAEDNSIAFNDAVVKVRELFLSSVRLHMRSDVPIGAALSGGIDSSAIVCAMCQIEPHVPMYTFSYISKGQKSEEKWVELVNEYTKSIGSKVASDPKAMISDLSDLISAQAEPFGTTSIYGQYRVFKSAKEKGVVVALEGQGAGELLAEYNGYPGERLLSPLELKKIVPVHHFSRCWGSQTERSYKLDFLYPWRQVLPGILYQLARKCLEKEFTPKWLNLSLMRAAGVKVFERRSNRKPANRGRRVIEKLRSSIWSRGLPSLLRHADRNSMFFSLESRVPFLTAELAEYLFSLPEEYFISKSREAKHIPRLAMEGILPQEFLERQDKIGFDVESAQCQDLYIKELSKTETRNIARFVDIPMAMREKKFLSEQFFWRLLNYSKWYNLFFDDCIERIGKC